jgi:uncharacterized membrane protein
MIYAINYRIPLVVYHTAICCVKINICLLLTLLEFVRSLVLEKLVHLPMLELRCKKHNMVRWTVYQSYLTL